LQPQAARLVAQKCVNPPSSIQAGILRASKPGGAVSGLVTLIC
jgi:hypothetical protein